MQTLRDQARRLYERSISLAPRSEDPYATHVPILIGVAAACSPRSLIEFGSGTLSTLSFLDEVAFPSLQKVESYENNKQWFDQVRERIPAHGRIDLRLVEGEMYRAVDAANTPAADMIFIDDSPTAEARVPTVEEVARRCGTGPVVVLHDNDLRKLRRASRKFENRIACKAFNPQTCIMWHGHPERRSTLERVERIICQHAAEVPLSDIRAWREIFLKGLA
jgi:predicted O-methyltransferase YrrM